MNTSYALKLPNPDEEDKWLRITSFSGVPEPAWVPQWYLRSLLPRDQITYWKSRLGKGKVVIVRRKVTPPA